MTTPAHALPRIIAPFAKQEEKTCATCGQPFWQMCASYTQEDCFDCLDARTQAEWPKERQRMIESSTEVRAALWQRICPQHYQANNRTKLPLPEKFDEALQWQHGPKGLLLRGPSGKGKSRALWAVAHREFMAGRSIAVLDAGAAIDYAAQFEKGVTHANAWIKKYCRADIVLFDDTFKAKISDSFEQALFTILERRMANGLPILCAINDTGETLKARMSEDRGSAFVRRLRECCHAINFAK